LSKKIGSVARGNLDTTIDVDGKDGIGILARQFQYMIRSIGELLEEVHRSNEQKRALEKRQNEIRLKMMASQIHPHFLFNALEAVRMKAHMKGEAEIADIVKMIGRLMRKMLESGADRVPLRDELETVRCYLEIQKFRQGDRLSYEISVEPGLENVAVLPLSIQPLVENAVIHGIEKKEGGAGWVRVRCLSREDGGVRIEVADNGAGMSAERLARVTEGLDNPEEEGHRIGMRNVHQRLRFTYGEGFGLAVASLPGQGTTVSFDLPEGGNGVV
jgi:two-component system sensor histidine kinase YesM